MLTRIPLAPRDPQVNSAGRFAIMLATQRTGTGAFGSVLDQHPSIRSLGEVFHSDGTGGPPSYFWFLQRLAFTDPSFAMPGRAGEKLDRYLADLAAAERKPRIVLDVKYRSTHHFNEFWYGMAEPPNLFSLLKDRSIPVIHLLRRNTLKTIISGRLAEANRVWHMSGSETLAAATIRLDAERVARDIEHREREIETICRILRGHPAVLTLHYEDLFDRETGGLAAPAAEAVCAFLGVEPFTKLAPVYRKQTKDRLSEVIENYGEVHEALAGTPHAWMLEGDTPPPSASPPQESE